MPPPLPQPFHIDLSASEHGGVDSSRFDQRNLNPKGYAIPIGLGVVGVVLLIFGSANSDAMAVIFGLALCGAAVVAAFNKSTGAVRAASAPLLTVPVPDAERQ